MFHTYNAFFALWHLVVKIVFIWTFQWFFRFLAWREGLFKRVIDVVDAVVWVESILDWFLTIFLNITVLIVLTVKFAVIQDTGMIRKIFCMSYGW